MNKRLWTALVVYVGWILVTLYGAKWLHGGEKVALNELVKNGVGWQFAAAVVALFAAIALFKWRDMHCGAPHSLLKVMWFPVLVLLAISSLALITGLPSGRQMFFIFLNTLLVGVSEEVMFRGVLFRALLTNYRVWTAIIVTTVLFGGIHVLNVFTTGELVAAMLQSVGAAMSGLFFIAIVIRTGSLWPAIIYHGLWDCALFLIKVGSQTSGIEADPALAEQMMNSPAMFLPLLLAVPNFVCALVLLRKVRDANFREEDAAAA